jgi:hypothetical protein
MTMVYLEQLDDLQFSDLVSKAMHQRYVWPQFLEPAIIERTRSTLIELKTTLIAQVQDSGEEADPDWLRRIQHKRRVIDSRLVRINSLIREEKTRRSATVEHVSKKYSTLAFRLAEALQSSDNAFMLDEIFLDDITAGEWLMRRREILLEKERRG